MTRFRITPQMTTHTENKLPITYYNIEQRFLFWWVNVGNTPTLIEAQNNIERNFHDTKGKK